MEIKTYVIAVSQWINNFKDNPVQRRTADHARKALKYHLSSYSPTQQCVVGAVLNNEVSKNEYYKVDGHTRSYLWENDLLQKPENVHVTTYHCSTLQEVIDLYTCYDASTAAETSADKYAGACRLVGFEPKSSLLKKCPVSSIYRILSNSYSLVNTYDYVKALLPALKKIDDLNLPAKYSIAPLLAMITTFLCYDAVIVANFWTSVHKDKGTKDITSGMDGIQAAIEILNYKPTAVFHNIRDLQIHQCEQLIACFENYIKNRKIKRRSQLKKVDIHEYFRAKYAKWAELSIPTKSIKKVEIKKVSSEPAQPDHPQAEL